MLKTKAGCDQRVKMKGARRCVMLGASLLSRMPCELWTPKCGFLSSEPILFVGRCQVCTHLPWLRSRCRLTTCERIHNLWCPARNSAEAASPINQSSAAQPHTSDSNAVKHSQSSPPSTWSPQTTRMIPISTKDCSRQPSRFVPLHSTPSSGMCGCLWTLRAQFTKDSKILAMGLMPMPAVLTY